MPHFKDKNNNLHFLDDASFIHLLPEGCIEITDEEEEAIRVSNIQPPTLSERRLAKQREIDTLEATLFMTRGEREAWLIQMETIATQQSVSLEVLYQANPFYKKLKDCDVAVTALRAELKVMV